MSPARRRTAAGLLALAAAAAALGRSLSRTAADELVVTGAGFAVRAPREWLVVNPEAARVLAETRGGAAPQELLTALEGAPLAISFQAAVPRGRYAPTVSVALAPAGTRLLDAGASLSAPLGAALGPVSFRSERNGPERLVSVAEVRAAGRTVPFRIIQTSLPGRGRSFIITCAGSDEDFDEAELACRTVTGSVRELGAPTAAFAAWGAVLGAAAFLLYALAL